MIISLVACQRICASRVLAYRNDDLTVLHDHEVVVEDGMMRGPQAEWTILSGVR